VARCEVSHKLDTIAATNISGFDRLLMTPSVQSKTHYTAVGRTSSACLTW
jgi:hypothetical protein